MGIEGRSFLEWELVVVGGKEWRCFLEGEIERSFLDREIVGSFLEWELVKCGRSSLEWEPVGIVEVERSVLEWKLMGAWEVERDFHVWELRKYRSFLVWGLREAGRKFLERELVRVEEVESSFLSGNWGNVG